MNTLKVKDTETIDRFFLELSQFTNARTADESKYDQLIYAVERKFPGESRFETALRYITTAEEYAKTGGGGCASGLGHNVELTGSALLRSPG